MCGSLRNTFCFSEALSACISFWILRTLFLLPDLKFLFTEYWISYPVTYRFFFHVICAFLPDRFFAVIRVVPAGLTVTVILFVAALYPAVAEERIVILALPVNFAAMVILPFLSTFTDLLLEEYFSGAFHKLLH